MALKIDKELVDDAKKEHKLNNHKNVSESVNNDVDKSVGENVENLVNQSETVNNETINNESVNSSNEFKEKFEEYFKGAGSIIAGSAITELVDDFKTKLLFIYAKKQGVDLPVESLKMDAKSKEFCSFLIDYAIKNKLFGFIEKYPLVAAGGVVAISGLSSFLFVEMMKKSTEKAKQAEKENEILKTELKKYKDAEVVRPILEGESVDFVNGIINDLGK